MAHSLTEADLEQRTDALLEDLEAAKDPVAYRQRYHERSASTKNAASRKRSASTANRRSAPRASGTYALPSPSRTFWGSPLLITAFAILLGTLIGSLASLYLS